MVKFNYTLSFVTTPLRNLQFLNTTINEINLAQLYNGVYMVLVESEGSTKLGRVIKMK